MEQVTSRACNTCGETKPVSEMVASARYRGGYMPTCKTCRNKYWRDRHAANPVARKKHAAAVVRSNRLRAYGITSADYSRMVAEQGDTCALCGTADKGRTERYEQWCVDHCHATGRVRGLLCYQCNNSVGHHERLARTVGVDKLLAYLLNPPEPECPTKPPSSP